MSGSGLGEFFNATVDKTGGYKLPVTFLATAQAGNSLRLKRGSPHVVMANITTATPIRFTPKPAFTWREDKDKYMMPPKST
ncbi:hypothetical protein INR49_004111 [Caranx melampygus]|nr:hypothetical protein INR49_004111 [Caranx melampygus]